MSLKIKNYTSKNWKGEERTLKKIHVDAKTPATHSQQKGFTSQRTVFIDEQGRFAEKESKTYDFVQRVVEPKVKDSIVQ